MTSVIDRLVVRGEKPCSTRGNGKLTGVATQARQNAKNTMQLVAKTTNNAEHNKQQSQSKDTKVIVGNNIMVEVKTHVGNLRESQERDKSPENYVMTNQCEESDQIITHHPSNSAVPGPMKNNFFVHGQKMVENGLVKNSDTRQSFLTPAENRALIQSYSARSGELVSRKSGPNSASTTYCNTKQGWSAVRLPVLSLGSTERMTLEHYIGTTRPLTQDSSNCNNNVISYPDQEMARYFVVDGGDLCLDRAKRRKRRSRRSSSETSAVVGNDCRSLTACLNISTSGGSAKGLGLKDEAVRLKHHTQFMQTSQCPDSPKSLPVSTRTTASGKHHTKHEFNCLESYLAYNKHQQETQRVQSGCLKTRSVLIGRHPVMSDNKLLELVRYNNQSPARSRSSPAFTVAHRRGLDDLVQVKATRLDVRSAPHLGHFASKSDRPQRHSAWH